MSMIDTLLFLIAYMIAQVLLFVRVGLAAIRRSIITPNPYFFYNVFTHNSIIHKSHQQLSSLNSNNNPNI